MEETSRQLKTLAAMELSDVDLLQKQFEYQQKYIILSDKKLQEITKNVTAISYQLNDISRAKGIIISSPCDFDREKILTGSMF